MHVPRSLVIVFLITVGCAIGWFLSGSAQAAPDGGAEVATAAGPAPPLALAEPVAPVPVIVTGNATTGSSAMAIAATVPGDGPSTTGSFGGQATTASSSIDLAVGPLAPSAPMASQAPPAPPVTVLASAPVPVPVPAPTVDAPSAAPPASVAASPPTPQGLIIPIPPFPAEAIFTPLPGAASRGVSVMGWESFRVDVAGAGITVTADDSNLFRDRDGKLNGNTGDTDASGLNVTDATDSVIYGSESADEAPYQTLADALVEFAGGRHEPAADDDEDADVEDLGDEEEEADEPLGDVNSAAPARATASAAVVPDDDDDTADEGWDFPYDAWVRALDPDVATAVDTDEGTTLASGADAVAVGGDGYDDDDIRAAGSDITITRDDGNVVLGGTGDVNAQIGDSEQGAVIMDVEGTLIRGGGAY